MNSSFNENIIPFTIGRMNPPTTGHMLLIRNMMIYSIQNNLTQINIILSGTIDNKKNPISCKEKRNLLFSFLLKHQKELLKIEQPLNSSKLDNLKTNIICMNDIMNPSYGTHPIMKSIHYLLYEIYGYPRPNLNMVLFIGQDRENDFLWLKKTLGERDPSIGLTIEPMERPPGAMSATFLRQLAISGDYDEFKKQMLETGLNDESSIQNLYEEIREKLYTNPAISGKKSRSKKGGKGNKRRNKTFKKGKRKERKERKELKKYTKKKRT